MKDMEYGSRRFSQLSQEAIEQAAEGILWFDSDGRIHMANNAACRLLGYSREELLTMTVPDFDPEYSAEDYKDKYWRKVRQLGTINFESFHRRKDGSIYPVEISSSYVHFEGDGYSCTFFRDITERRRVQTALQESENKLSAIINHHFQLTGLLNIDGRILMANETALNLIGAEEEDVLGKYFWDTPWWNHSRELQTELKQKVKQAAGGEFVRFEAIHPDIHGESRLHDISLNPLLDDQGNATHIIPEARDITDIKKTESALHQALAELEQLKNRLEDENVYLQEEIRLDHNFGEIIGGSKALKKILGQIEQVASTDATVLILGETGTGKELIARAIHELSNRNSRPLVKVNCAALPANLIESELFGHEKGAFTGALARKIGRFELADRGTIFLDEIGDLPLELQAKLLRILQEGEFERLGNPETITVDVRVLAATNRDLAKTIRKGDFREDLFYRLNVYPVTCPSLRDRRDDIPLLVKHFVDKYSTKIGKKIYAVPKNIMKALQSYHWPGNVRELENIVERALVISRGDKLEIGDWLPRVENGVHQTTIPTLPELEREHILKVLELTSWRVSGSGGAAEKLGLKPTTLEARMKKFGIRRM
ncbi:hypothetical protein D1AOALGA4SA_4805 [Olavius algarvensis Delta 1 endosymbiont]|nr:hypothetical protein D1AOALGA4SA_4805 [Olavius algarvensis Delta 1 endosymbiont]